MSKDTKKIILVIRKTKDTRNEVIIQIKEIGLI